MARKARNSLETSAAHGDSDWLEELGRDDKIAEVPGPGRWFSFEYLPTSMFSLKISLATSSVGKTLVIPTPYSIKMAFVDAAFRAGFSDSDAAEFLLSLSTTEVRISPCKDNVVTHTFVKIRQESRESNSIEPYTSSIAYRELVHQRGRYRWAFDLAGGSLILVKQLIKVAPHVSYIGKRGSFVQYVGVARFADPGPDFTQPVDNDEPWELPQRAHAVPLDDFGPNADLETLSSFSDKKASRDKHRRFVRTVIPVGVTNTGPAFTEYRAN